MPDIKTVFKKVACYFLVSYSSIAKAFAFLVLMNGSIAAADTRFVTDRLILNLRSGPTTSHRIIKTLSSGAALKVVEGSAAENGHIMVKTSSGLEGWVLEQYVQTKPIARTQLANLTKNNEALKQEITSLKEQLNTTSTSLDSHSQQQSEMAKALKEKEQELQTIKSLSANAIEIDQRNAQLTESNQNLQLEVDKLRAENDRLSGSDQRTQWLTGAALILIGFFSSWLVINFSGRKKSNWS